MVPFLLVYMADIVLVSAFVNAFTSLQWENSFSMPSFTKKKYEHHDVTIPFQRSSQNNLDKHGFVAALQPASDTPFETHRFYPITELLSRSF